MVFDIVVEEGRCSVPCPYVRTYIDMDAAWIISISGVAPRWDTRPSKSLTNMFHLDATLTVLPVCPVIIPCVRLSGAIRRNIEENLVCLLGSYPDCLVESLRCVVSCGNGGENG